MGIQRGVGVGTGYSDPAGKSQVAIGFLRNSGKDPLRKQYINIAYCLPLGR